MRTLLIAFFLLPLAGFADEVRIAVGQSRDEAVAAMKQHGGIDITSDLEVVGPKGEHPLTGIYWGFRDYDAIIVLTTKDAKVAGMTFWTRRDFGESKLHRAERARSITVLKLDTNTKGVSIEKRDGKG